MTQPNRLKTLNYLQRKFVLKLEIVLFKGKLKMVGTGTDRAKI